MPDPLFVLGCLAAFRSLYLLAGAGAALCGRRLSPEALSRLVSSAHACALAALGALAAARPELGGAPWWRRAGCAIPLGYLAHDAALIWGEPSLWEPSMLAHHFAFAALVAAGAEKYPGLAARAYLAELSTPLLHAAWGARRSGADRLYPRAAAALGAALLVAFLYFRVYSLAALAAEAYALGERALGLLVAGLAGLNWYWFALLFRRAVRAVAGGAPPRPSAPEGRRRLRKI